MKKIDVLDFDKTIYKKDSSKQFFLFCITKKWSLVKYLTGIIISFLLYFLRLISKESLKEYYFKFVREFDDIDKIVDSFWKINKDYINNDLLNGCKNDIVVVSASPEFLLKNVCKELKIKKVIASKIDKNTGKFEMKNCYGEEKVNRIKKELNNFEIIDFYSDSLSDEPLARISKNPYLVKKNKIEKWNFDNKKNNDLSEVIRYLIIGVLTMVITLGTYCLLTISILDPQNKLELQTANFISWFIAMLFSYIANRIYVFKSQSSNFIKEFLNFMVSRILTLFVDMFGMFLFVSVLFVNDRFSKCFVQVLVVILNYIISKFIVFRRKKNELYKKNI